MKQNNILVFAYYDSGVQYDAVLNNIPIPDPQKKFIKNCYEAFTTDVFADVFTEAYNCVLYVIDNGYIRVFDKDKGEHETMTTHINETCTLMCNTKKVQDFQNKLHIELTDADFLRKFNENFDEKITGKVLSCDIQIYDLSTNPYDPVTLDVELTVYNADYFCVVKYSTDTEHYLDPKVTTYILENS